MTLQFARQTAIAGIGATEFSKDSGRTPMQLATEACLAACADAGLDPGRGRRHVVTYSAEKQPRDRGGPQPRCPRISPTSARSTTAAARRVAWWPRPPWPSTAAPPTTCCATGRSTSGPGIGSGWECRTSTDTPRPSTSASAGPPRSDCSRRPSGSPCSPPATCTSTAPRPRTSAGSPSPTARHAATNPTAFFYGKPITLDDHQESRWIVEPLHLLDCCQESDGGQALLVTSAERAAELARSRPRSSRPRLKGWPRIST